MQRGFWFVIAVVLLATMTAFAAMDRGPIQNYPVRGGSNDPAIEAQSAPDRGVWQSTLDSVGTRYLAGYSYYEYQHNGTAGRMIYTDASGIVHVVWMRGLTASIDGARHIYYNFWDPSVNEFTIQTGGEPVGSIVDVHTRAGYTGLCGLPDGWVFPVFHEIAGGDANAHVAASIDFSPGLGAFTSSGPTPLQGPGYLLEAIWPKIAIGPDSTIHVTSCENPYQGAAGDPQRIYYSRGRPTWDNDGFGQIIEWENVNGNQQYWELDTVMVIAPIVIASKAPGSSRVAILWAKSRDDLTEIDPGPSQYNNDLYVMMSEDGGHNWGAEQNITQFIYPDLDCVSGDTAVCDRDTFRLYTDLNGIFDMNDVLHVSFTTPYYYELEGTVSYAFAEIWHWDEQHQEFSNMVHGWMDLETSEWYDPGAWQKLIQRPCLSLDQQTGYLYCTYHYYDPYQTSEAGFPQGDIYVTYSRNCGRSWSEGINITSTNGGISAPAGTSLSEKDATACEFITYEGGVGYLDVFYLLDLDAGSLVQEEGSATNNPLFFRRVPVDELTWQLHDPFFPPMHSDSTGFPGRIIPLDPEAIAPCILASNEHYDALRPESFKLYQNYPNPFNPTTNIQFDLVRDARVSLKVYNVMGQAVATLYDGQMLNAGVRTVEFDASNLASGVYVYRIEADGATASMKMVLMK